MATLLLITAYDQERESERMGELVQQVGARPSRSVFKPIEEEYEHYFEDMLDHEADQRGRTAYNALRYVKVCQVIP